MTSPRWPSAIQTAAYVAEYLNACRARRLSDRTIGAYRWALNKLPAATLSPDALEAALADLHLSAESCWDAFRVWRTFWSWCERRKGIPNPMAELDPPLRRPLLPRYLHWTQIERLLAVCHRRRDRALVLLILDTGLRLGEIAHLQPTDVGDDVLTVTGKRGERQVPISPDVRRALVGVLPWGISQKGLYTVIKRRMIDAGIRQPVSPRPAAPPRATGPRRVQPGPHTLRHSMAVHYLLNGGDLLSLQRILGHKDLDSTRIYLELAMSDVKRQHARYSPALALLQSAATAT